MSNKCKDGIKNSFGVYVRIRPLNETKEIKTTKKLSKDFITIIENQINLIDPEISSQLIIKKEKSYTFDEIFLEKQKNKEIFEKVVKAMIDNTLNGYNSTLLAYGVTGTGKTHTVFGDIYKESNREKGVSTYSMEYLFSQIELLNESSFQVKISYLEIYNEQVIDLLIDNSPTLLIIEDQIKGVIVPDLSEFTVTNTKDLMNIVIEGNKRRTMGATGNNQFSSRSHAILHVMIEKKNLKSYDFEGEVTFSKILLVDLAGSERGGLEKGLRLQEGSNINKSLLSLGNCINILSDKNKIGSFVPYRDSKLTRLLKDSLGGNIQTSMIACINPSPYCYEEIVNTLNYASRASKIEKKIYKNTKNEFDNNYSNFKEIIEKMQLEIYQLKDIIRSQNFFLKNNITINNINNNNIDQNLNVNNNFLPEKKINVLNIVKNSDEDMNYQVNPEIYTKFLKQNMIEINYEEFEKYIEGLKFDKNFLEEQIEKGKTNDTSLMQKYLYIKSILEKYLELINDKLVENVEQNMILKSNLKEITELNINNQNQIDLLCLQKSNFENDLKIEENIANQRELLKIYEEIDNINRIISDNNKTKESIIISLENTIKTKKKLKSTLLRMISNSKQAEITDWHKAYKILEKDKIELEHKNIYYNQLIQSLVLDKENLEKSILELNKRLSAKDQKLKQLESLEKRNSNNFNDEWMRPLRTETNLPLTSNSLNRFNLFETEKCKAVHKNPMIESTSEKQLKQPNNLYIEKITPLTNFKIGLENFKFTKIENSKNIMKEIKKRTSKHLKGKKSISQQPFIRGSKIENNLGEIYSIKSKLLGNKLKETIKRRTITKGMTKNIITEKNENENPSLSLSKVTLRNELNFNSEIEYVDNLVNINDSNLLKDVKYESEDTLMLTQLNDLIVNNKQCSKNVNLNKFIDNVNKINKNFQFEYKDYNKFINIQTGSNKIIKNATLENELNKLFDRETVEIYNNIYKENTNYETNNINVQSKNDTVGILKKKSSSVIKDEKRLI